MSSRYICNLSSSVFSLIFITVIHCLQKGTADQWGKCLNTPKTNKHPLKGCFMKYITNSVANLPAVLGTLLSDILLSLPLSFSTLTFFTIDPISIRVSEIATSGGTEVGNPAKRKVLWECISTRFSLNFNHNSPQMSSTRLSFGCGIHLL